MPVSRRAPPPKPHPASSGVSPSPAVDQDGASALTATGGPPRLRPPNPSAPAPPRLRTSRPPLSATAKEALTLQALGILREQVEARVVHYKAELETSAELDAVTAEVVKQVKALQAAAVRHRGPPKDPTEVEQAHVETLGRLLKKVLVSDDNFALRYVQPIGKRLAKLFFESQLETGSERSRERSISLPEQAVFYALRRHRRVLQAELESFDYDGPDTKRQAAALMTKVERDLQVTFLSRRSPELNRVLAMFTGVLADFFREHLPGRLEQMAKLTIRGARTARRDDSVPYKVLPNCFADFRTEWERVLMTQMIHYCGDTLVARLGTDPEVRTETLDFFSEPQIYSETCGVICDGLYDQLCLEGFLDLPVDWRVQINSRR